MIADFLADSSIDGWDAVLAVAVAAAGWVAASLAKNAVLGLMHRWSGVPDSTATLVARLVRYAMLLLVLGIVLTVLGAPLQPVLAAVVLVSVVAGLALRGIAANFGAGVVIQVRHVVKVGDEIEVVGIVGTVKELNGRAVVLHAADGKAVRIPNSLLLDNPLVNITERQLYRSEIEVRVRGAEPYREVADLIVTTLVGTDRIKAVPSPQALVALHGPATTTFRVRFWHDPHHRGEVRSAAVSALIDALDAAGTTATVDWTIPRQPFTPPPPV